MNDIKYLETSVQKKLEDTNKLITDLALDETILHKNIDQKEKNILIGKARAYDEILKNILSIRMGFNGLKTI